MTVEDVLCPTHKHTYTHAHFTVTDVVEDVCHPSI